MSNVLFAHDPAGQRTTTKGPTATRIMTTPRYHTMENKENHENHGLNVLW
jgi:hypothetical protein